MQLSRIFVRHTRHPHHLPGAPVAGEVAGQQGQQPRQIQFVRLGTPRAPLHFDARRIDDVIGDAVRHQIPVQPEGVAAGLVAADHRRVVGELQSTLGAGNFLDDAIDRAGGYLANARPLATAGGEAQLPASLAELEGEQQIDCRCRTDRGGRGRLIQAGRGLHRYALLVV
jgi:hypothetical protein